MDLDEIVTSRQAQYIIYKPVKPQSKRLNLMLKGKGNIFYMAT